MPGEGFSEAVVDVFISLVIAALTQLTSADQGRNNNRADLFRQQQRISLYDITQSEIVFRINTQSDVRFRTLSNTP